jgi:hypothetical protein
VVVNKLLNLIGWRLLPDFNETYRWRRVFVFSVICLLVAVTHSLVTGRFWDVHEYYWGTRPGWAW